MLWLAAISWLGCLALLLRFIVRRLRSRPSVSRPRAIRFSEIQSPELDSRYLRFLYSKVHGVSYRQDAVRRCRPGDALVVVREPESTYDRNAVRIHRLLFDGTSTVIGEQLGYLSRELAEEFAPKLDENRLLLFPHVTEITGSLDTCFGVNIEITLYAGDNYGKHHLAKATG